VGLRWIMQGQYAGYGRVYGPALALLFEQRRAEFERAPALPKEGDVESPAGEMLEIAARMAQGAGRYAANFDDVRAPLVAASWLARVSSRPEPARQWLELCARNSKGDDALWCRAQLLLLDEERQQDSLETREQSWTKFNADVRLAERTPATEALLALSDFWSDMSRESTRRALEQWLGKNPGYWIAFAKPRDFVDFLVGLRLAPVKRSDAVNKLEALANGSGSGWLALLRQRAGQWLPPEKPNG